LFPLANAVAPGTAQQVFLWHVMSSSISALVSTKMLCAMHLKLYKGCFHLYVQSLFVQLVASVVARPCYCLVCTQYRCMHVQTTAKHSKTRQSCAHTLCVHSVHACINVAVYEHAEVSRFTMFKCSSSLQCGISIGKHTDHLASYTRKNSLLSVVVQC
jgi:hypothetical protein